MPFIQNIIYLCTIKKQMFSKTCEYAIRAMLFIAQKSKSGSKTGIREIAAGIDAPEHFIAKILQGLVRKGMLQSLKGPTGGFYLDKESMRSSFADIVKVIDGDNLFSGCGLGLRICSEVKPCPIHNQFKIIRKNIYNMLEQAKIGEFSRKLERDLVFLNQQ